MFLKDPHQIIAEHKLTDTKYVTRMDFESINGIHQYTDGLLASNPSVVQDETPSAEKLHVDFDKTADVHHEPIDANDFYFGKNGDAVDDFHANINTLPSSITSNGNDEKFSSKELNVARSIDDDEHDDFGPETDVDATDDNAISPLSPSVSKNY